MGDVIGRGVIEVSADATKLKAGIDDAKKSLKSLGIAAGDATKSQSASIDRYVKQLGIAAATTGKTGRELELYKLALRGASADQLKAADSALRMTEAYQKGVDIGNRVRTTILAVGAAAVAGGIAAAAAFDSLVKKAGDFQDMAEKIGDSAESIASLSVAAAVGGVSMESLVGAANKLTKGLTGVDDDSKAAGAAIEALGLNIEDFKNLKPADQIETVAKALSGFQDGAGKSAVAMALFGKAGAEMLPFLKELAGETGRQNILSAEQIALADEYADKQAKLGAQISLHAQAIAVEMLPSYLDLQGAFSDAIKGMADLKTGADGLGKSTAIADFADDGVQALAFLVDSADGVVRAFQLVGTAIAGATAMALSPIQQTKTIYAAMAADMDKILMRPQLGARLADRKAARPNGKIYDPFDPDAGGWQIKPRLAPPVTTKKGKDTAAQESKAQLALDLERIKSSSESLTNTYANAESIMEARRAAGLINEQEYYAAKLAFLNLNSSAQEAALQAEIDRLGEENVSGKDRIENQKKIVEAQTKLDKVRENAVANVEVLSEQEKAANEKITKSYINATTAAQDYIDTIKKRNDREIAGLGKGTKSRDEESGRNQIEDTLITEKKTLARDLRNKEITQDYYNKYLEIAQSTYEQELESYNDTIDKKTAKNADWLTGATEAMQNYADESKNLAKQIESGFTDAFSSIEDAMVDWATTGELSFTKLGNSIIATIVRIQTQAALSSITDGLKSYLTTAFGSSSSYDTTVSSMQQEASNELALLSSGFHTGGIVGSEPTFTRSISSSLFAGATKYHTGGIAGDEVPAILQKGEGVFTAGQMAAMGNSGSNVSVTVNNTASDKVESTVKPKMNNGKLELEVLIAQVLTKDMRNNGSITQGMQSTFGLARAT